MNSYFRSFFIALAIMFEPQYVFGQKVSQEYPCFNAISVGNVKVDAPECQEGDPLKLGQNELIKSVMKGFSIDSALIAFQGCERTNFRVMELANRKDKARFLISYPLDIGNRFLAPVAHELAHVVQILKVGDSLKLKESSTSIKIELAADFMVGYSFARYLKNVPLEQFQENLSLVGLYVEKDIDAHGTPEQRTSAFRMGAVNAYPFSELILSKAVDYFIRNTIYAILSR